MSEKVSVVVLAAGLGTRMRSKRAKVLHQAGGKALIEHVLKAAAAIAPPDGTFVVIGHQADQVRALLKPRGFRFIDQAEQLGTGHALLCGRTQLEPRDGILMILNGDGPLLRPGTLRELLRAHQTSGAAGTIMSAELDDPTGYGRIIRSPSGAVLEVIEQKAATPAQLLIRESNTGQYCFNNDTFWKHAVELTANNPAKEYYLTDMVAILIAAGHRIEAFRVGDATEVKGINTRVELAEVDRIFRDRKVQELMLEGVTIEKPETVTVDQDVAIGMDTVIEPFVRITGHSSIGENCRIGAGAVIQNSKLADGVEISTLTVIQDSTIDDEATLGPFTRLRPGNLIGKGAHLGNFVEAKNSNVGAGVKAGHLSYLGDSLIGNGANIGAGTITCNFDGFKKHRTEIGEDAFIGSNSTLVAPVRISPDSYIAAGSVITENVPELSLGIGRAKQVTKEGWVERRRKEREIRESGEPVEKRKD